MSDPHEGTQTAVGITVSNRQRGIPVNFDDLQTFAHRALQTCRETLAPRKLTSGDVTVVIISDRRMAELHQRFMNIAGATDVITFQHGEIFISAETAKRNARRFRNPFARELQLYLVHGLLHLHGFEDRTAAESRRMNLLQTKILRKANQPKTRTRAV
jgi:probable rRNA maturation factor